MKQNVSPAVVAVIVVIVLAIIGVVGYKVINPGGKIDVSSMDKKYGVETRHSAEGMAPPMPGQPGSGAAMSSGSGGSGGR